MRFWRTRRGWPAHFHNGVYRELAGAAPVGGFTDAWWYPFLALLRAWRATRPRSDEFLTANFRVQAATLGAAWAACAPARSAPDIAAVGWDEVVALPDAAAAIKPTKSRSPVFPSKCCHFLMPQVFPVYDRTAVGGRWKSYEAYFYAVLNEWAATSTQDRQALTAAPTGEWSRRASTDRLVVLTMPPDGRRGGGWQPRTPPGCDTRANCEAASLGVAMCARRAAVAFLLVGLVRMG